MRHDLCYYDLKNRVQRMFIDIAANLSDEMFKGVYHDKKRHEPDLGAVIERAKEARCDQMIVLAGTLLDAEECSKICSKYDPECKSLFTTVGFHPTRCSEAQVLVGSESSSEASVQVIHEKFSSFMSAAGIERVVGIGEFGLDYDRLHFCPADVQREFFKVQLEVAGKFDLPLLLHLRNAFEDFVTIYKERKTPSLTGVVHSFTGTVEEMKALVDLGLYIGINGCSLRDAMHVVPHIPEDRILFETDAPYCDIRPTHGAFQYLNSLELPKTVKPEKYVPNMLVKGRNEPACINQVAHAVAGIRGMSPIDLAQIVRANTLRLFRKLVR